MPASDRSLKFDRLACITIQGGGVFGLNLLGQLQAVLELGYTPVALSGNSAGAIAAALYWAGLDPPEVFDLLIEQATDPNKLTNLLGPFHREDGGKFDLEDLRQFQNRLSSYLRELRIFRDDVKYGPFVKLIAILKAYLKHGTSLSNEFDLCEPLCQACGIFMGDALEAFIEEALRRSPYVRQNQDLLPECFPGEGEARPLTFAHFRKIRKEGRFTNMVAGQSGRPYLPPLFLTATNLTTRSLELINSLEDRYQDLSVARAVRASAAFPAFFQPVTQVIEKNEYSFVDGGMIANYPAFVFGSQFREWLVEQDPDAFSSIALRPWVHVGLRLSSPKRSVGRAGEAANPRAFLKAMSELLIYQARNDLEEKLAKYVPRSIVVELQSDKTAGPEGVLDVEKLRRFDVEAMYHNGYKAGKEALCNLQINYPAASEVEPLLEELIVTVEGLFPVNPRSLRLRSNIFVPKGDNLILHYRARMEAPPPGKNDGDRDKEENDDDHDKELNRDWDLVLPYRHGLTGFCFVRRRPLLCNLDKFKTLYKPGQPVDPKVLFGFDEKTQKKIRGDRSWLLSVPIFDPETLTTRPLITKRVPPADASGLEGQYYVQDEPIYDGAVFGVLNLDAGWEYTTIGLSENPEEFLKDSRIRAIVALMQRQALRLGDLFSKRFPSKA